ncbi:hypothetical protein GR160_16000 [Flavobacterium sp. Sd200]|uniref:hypothetical protein n=1 Tax=Flavobacterium sp. Sd200 TaxID=2692211 RepID=UPI00136967E2|nr:hypothetical protein [Flavobacterium sp. Sd200]MXN92732.1 hypothetical protein [Flavobacterium sp. Sd200]
MKTIQIFAFAALLSFAVGCKKDTPTEPTVEQTEQGTLPDATAIDTVTPAEADSIPADTVIAPK